MSNDTEVHKKEEGEGNQQRREGGKRKKRTRREEGANKSGRVGEGYCWQVRMFKVVSL